MVAVLLLHFDRNSTDELSQNSSGDKSEAHHNQMTIITEVLDNNSHVAIRIKDNGMGMSEEVQQKIFEHLYQVIWNT